MRVTAGDCYQTIDLVWSPVRLHVSRHYTGKIVERGTQNLAEICFGLGHSRTEFGQNLVGLQEKGRIWSNCVTGDGVEVDRK